MDIKQKAMDIKQKAMDIKQKLRTLSYLYKTINENQESDTYFLCILYKNFNGKTKKMIDEFPELAAEIIKIGQEHDPSYEFPNALQFKDVNGILVISSRTKEKFVEYNIHKLELISRVKKQLEDKK